MIEKKNKWFIIPVFTCVCQWATKPGTHIDKSCLVTQVAMETPQYKMKDAFSKLKLCLLVSEAGRLVTAFSKSLSSSHIILLPLTSLSGGCAASNQHAHKSTPSLSYSLPQASSVHPSLLTFSASMIILHLWK